MRDHIFSACWDGLWTSAKEHTHTVIGSKYTDITCKFHKQNNATPRSGGSTSTTLSRFTLVGGK